MCFIFWYVIINLIIVISFILGIIEMILFWGYSKYNLLLKYNKGYVLILLNIF